jgi:hypothetical protein
VVKFPQFKLNPAASIQFQGHVFDVLAKDNKKKIQKGNIFHIDIQISSNLEDIKKKKPLKLKQLALLLILNNKKLLDNLKTGWHYENNN